MFYEVAKSAGGLGTRMFHWTTTIQQQLYWQKLCATHKNKISCGESSQIDGLEAGNITFKYYHLIWWAKVSFTNFLTVILPASKPNSTPYWSNIWYLWYLVLCIAKAFLDLQVFWHIGHIKVSPSKWVSMRFFMLCFWVCFGKVLTDVLPQTEHLKVSSQKCA